jgi:hypothetical protein
MPAAYRGFINSRWRRSHTDPKMFSRRLSLPAHLARHRPFNRERALISQVTFHNAGAAIPALFGIEHHRGFTPGRIRIQNIHRAYLNAPVAAVAYFLVEYYGLIRGYRIGQQIDFIFSHVLLLRGRCGQHIVLSTIRHFPSNRGGVHRARLSHLPI